MRRATQYLVSLPERTLRAVAAALGGTIHETAELVLPRLVRKSRFYEATAKNLLRITVELVGGVERQADAVADEHESSPKKLAVRKAGGNVVELGSILAFGFSPLWLLAAAADISHGTRVYLDALVGELKAAGVLAREAEFASVDDLLAALEGASGTIPPSINPARLPPLSGPPEVIAAELQAIFAQGIRHIQLTPFPATLAGVEALAPVLEHLR